MKQIFTILILGIFLHSCSFNEIDQSNKGEADLISNNKFQTFEFEYRIDQLPGHKSNTISSSTDPEQQNTVYVLLQVKKFRPYDQSSEEYKSYQQYLNFELDQDVSLLIKGSKLTPSFLHNEGGQSLTGYDRIILGFEIPATYNDHSILAINSSVIDSYQIPFKILMDSLNNKSDEL